MRPRVCQERGVGDRLAKMDGERIEAGSAEVNGRHLSGYRGDLVGFGVISTPAVPSWLSHRYPSKLQDEPVGDDLRARVALQRGKRFVDGRKGAAASSVVERARQPPQLDLEVGVGQ